MISVCMPSYNGEKYIFQQLQSILPQLSEEDEIIISDDGSIDKTLEILNSIHDKRIKIFNHKNTSGVISNVENALKHANGDVIFLADQDDVWLPHKVSTCLQALAKYDLVVSDCFIVDKDLNIIEESFYLKNHSYTNKWLALLRNSYLGCCMAFNRRLLDDALPFPLRTPMHDIWIGNVAAFRYKVAFIPDKLIYYRRHDANISTTSEPTKANLIKQIQFRIPIVSGLIKLFGKIRR